MGELIGGFAPRAAGRALGLMHDDVLPGVGARRIAERIEIDDVEAFDLRPPGQLVERGERWRWQRSLIDADLPGDGIVGVAQLVGTDVADAVGTAGELAGRTLPHSLEYIGRRGACSGEPGRKFDPRHVGGLAFCDRLAYRGDRCRAG